MRLRPLHAAAAIALALLLTDPACARGFRHGGHHGHSARHAFIGHLPQHGSHGRFLHHRHPRLGVFLGGGLWEPWGWRRAEAYVGPAPIYGVPIESYVEQDFYPDRPQTWYYCRESDAYYPYVSKCEGGWESVPAMLPGTESEAEEDE